MFFPVILCGGTGTRLWPLSRDQMPKQFVGMREQKTLFSDAVSRICSLEGVEHLIVVSNDNYRFYVQALLREYRKNFSIILEPYSKGTAPAVAFAAFSVMEQGDGILLVVPSDHMVKQQDLFAEAVRKSLMLAMENQMVTFGIEPDGAKTGFGYIKCGKALKMGGWKVEKFIEKPNLETAKLLLKQGGYYWNSGIFCFRASVFLAELEKFAPRIYECCEKSWHERANDLSFVRPSSKEFSLCPGDSIDFSVAERSQRLAMISLPKNVGWSDMGTWGAYYETAKKDKNQNVLEGDVIEKECQGCYIKSTDRLVAVLGLNNIAVIETKDSVLVFDKEKDQQVRYIVEKLKSEKRKELECHSLVYRPWGYYEVLAESSFFVVKKICIFPDEAISLQLHKNRSEHWVIVEGTAEVIRGAEIFTLLANESIYIPKETKHRIANHGSHPLIFIEVQIGSYLSERDVIRFEDKYGRVAGVSSN